MTVTRKKLSQPDSSPLNRTGASEKKLTAWGERIVSLLDGRSQTWLAQQAGVTKSNVSDIITKSLPAVDTALKISQALDVTAEFLFSGRNDSGMNPLMPVDLSDWIVVPHYRLSEFTEDGKPDPVENVPIRRDWLYRGVYTTTGLWMTELPISLPGLGDEGDTILCRDALYHGQEGFHLYFYDGIPVVREYTVGSARNPEDPESLADHHLVARILGAIKLRPFEHSVPVRRQVPL